MKAITLLNSSRLVIFENEDENYEYSAYGTAFICTYNDQLYVVTAAHVIKGYADDAIRVMIHPEGRDFLPYYTRVTLNSPNKEDPDHTDLAVLIIDQSMVDYNCFLDYPPLTLTDQSFKGKPPSGGKLIFRGFPGDRSSIDYDKLTIKQQPVILEGDWVGPAQMMEHCHEVKLDDVSRCTTLNGFSGSPVFWIGGTGMYYFAGVLIKGTHSSKTAYYLDAEVLKQTFQNILHNTVS